MNTDEPLGKELAICVETLGVKPDAPLTQKAVRLVQKGCISSKGEEYTVRGDTGIHTVTLHGHSCTCAAYSYKNPCAHRLAIQLYERCKAGGITMPQTETVETTQTVETTISMPTNTPAPARTVFTQIAAVMAEVAMIGVPKERRNPRGDGKYRGIDDIQVVMSGLLARHHLLILPGCHAVEWSERQTAKEGTLRFAVVKCSFTFIDSVTGSLWETTMLGEAFDAGDKALQKAQTFAYKQLLIQTFCIPVEGQEEPSGSVAAAREIPRMTENADLRANIRKLMMQHGKSNEDIEAWFAHIQKRYGADLEARLPQIYTDMVGRSEHATRATS